MNWRLCAGFLASEPAGFIVSKAETGPRLLAYTAVALGKPWPLREGDREPRGWDGSKILHVERGVDERDEAAQRAAIARCKAACQ